MDPKPSHDPKPAKAPKGIIRIRRGNDRNMWTKPLGQRPERLNPPVYDPS